MQTKEQIKRHWKVIAATATVSALGLGGAALADSNRDSSAPAAITLTDRTGASTDGRTIKTTGGNFQISGLNDSGDLDSPFDDSAASGGQGAVDDSPDANSADVLSADTLDSPDSPGTADSANSPDVAPAAPEAPPAPDSPASADSPADDSSVSASADS